MSENQDLSTGEKLNALWEKFAYHRHIVLDESVAIPFNPLSNSKVGYLIIGKDSESGLFEVSSSSEKDGSHFGFFTGGGFPRVGVKFNAETGVYSEGSAWISSKLGEGKDSHVKLGIKDEEGARRVGMFLERHIDNAWRHNGLA